MLWRVRGVTTLTGGFGGLLSFAKSRSNDKVAPIPVIRETNLGFAMHGNSTAIWRAIWSLVGPIEFGVALDDVRR